MKLVGADLEIDAPTYEQITSPFEEELRINPYCLLPFLPQRRCLRPWRPSG